MNTATLQIYDNEGKTFDRYTVVDVRDAIEVTERFGGTKQYYQCLGLSSNPSDPQGYSMWGGCILGKHLGKRIEFAELPENIQQHIIQRFKEV